MSDYTHICTLSSKQRNSDIVSQYIDGGIFIDFRRRLRKFVMVSAEHPLCKFYFRSTPAIRKEEAYHLLHYYYMVHPLSKFALYRRFLTFFVLTAIYIILPFMLLFLKSKKRHVFVILAFLQPLYILQMITTFNSGYMDPNKAIFKRKKVVLKYLKTYMIFDVLSVIPFFAKMMYWFLHMKFIFNYWRIFFLLENFKIARYFYWFECFQLIMAYYDAPKSISVITGINLRIFFILFLCFSIRQCLQTLDMSNNDLEAEFFYNFHDMTVELLGVGHTTSEAKEYRAADIYLSILFMCLGFCFVIKISCTLWQHLNKHFTTAFSETVSYGQYEAYASFNGLSADLKGEYYKEHIIGDVLNPELIKETRKSISRSRLEKVKLFSAIPDELKSKLQERLLTDIHLPGDVIIKAGTQGKLLYFIVSGTVIVTSPTGEHICCLEDGANFGEIALILNQKRTTTIIAATPCELLILRRSDFESVLNPYPDIKKVLKQEACQRLRATVATTSDGPVCHLFDAGSHTDDNKLEFTSKQQRQSFLEAMQYSNLHTIALSKNTKSLAETLPKKDSSKETKF